MAQELCQCQAATHGHEPGKCSNPATEPDNLCKACHDATVAPSGGAALVKLLSVARSHWTANELGLFCVAALVGLTPLGFRLCFQQSLAPARDACVLGSPP